ncbi:MAG: hypothetical protein KF809_17420 [Chloroflexi bacterium]|nr:hypothetical protein [Chloroflexota bacterium]
MRLLLAVCAAAALYAIGHARGWWQGVDAAIAARLDDAIEDEMQRVQTDIRMGFDGATGEDVTVARDPVTGQVVFYGPHGTCGIAGVHGITSCWGTGETRYYAALRN